MNLTVTSGMNVATSGLQQTPAQAPASAVTSTNPQSSTAAPTDTVTVSSAASVAASAASSTPAAATSWSDPAVSQALAALNDTSGGTSVADQVTAYQMLSGLVSNASNFDASNPDNTNAVDIATAFATSAFSQHVQSLMATNNSYMAQANSGVQLSETWQRQLNAFSNLSSDDQQALVAGINVSYAQQHPGIQAFTTQSWQDYSQARVNVNRATEAVATDPSSLDAGAASALKALTANYVDPATFTANANGYFTQYGPAPQATADQNAQDNAAAPPPPANTVLSADAVRSSFEAIAKLSDTSGKASLNDQIAAYQQLANGFGSTVNASIHTAVNSAFSSSAFFSRVQTVTDSYAQISWAGRNGSEASAQQAQINAFQSFSTGDQTIIASLSGIKGATAPADYLSYLADGLKRAATGDEINAAAQSGNQALYHSLIASLGTADNSPFVAAPKISISTGLQLNETA